MNVCRRFLGINRLPQSRGKLRKVTLIYHLHRGYSDTAVESQGIVPQFDYKSIVDRAKEIKANASQRNYDTDCINAVKSLYTERERLEKQAIQLRAERDKVNELIQQAASKDQRQQHIEAAKQWKLQIKTTEDRITDMNTELAMHAAQIPNNTHPDVPLGPESNARVLKIVGEKRDADFVLRDHLTLVEQLGMVDFEQAALITGSKWYYLKQAGVWLELALIQYALHKAHGRGFSPVITPDVVRTSIAHGCGFQPRKTAASQIYDVSTTSIAHSTAPKLCLIGTAEIPLAGMFATKMINEEELPKRIVGFSHAFRAEAGHGSAEERGLYRVHQFSKVELFAVSTPTQSDEILEEFRAFQEELFRDLGLCFRVLDMPTEELGASAYRKYDIEAWMPGRNQWGEISSTSNCTDYQARRLDIRYLSSQFKEHEGSKVVRVPWHIKEKWVHYCHTLNGTAMAVPRIIIALLETHQRADGSIDIPPPLRPWIPGQPHVLKREIDQT